jgi:hypothetical protein
MDPMDFTMDEAQASHQPPHAAHRHQCQPSQSSSSANSFTPHTRDSQHYDPVYDSSSGWYQANNTNAASRPSYTAPENIPHWGISPYLPVPSWQGQGLADVQHSGSQVQDSSTFSRQSRFMGMPWNEMRGFDSSPFGYNSYTSPLNSTNTSSESTSGGISAQTSAVPAISPHIPSTYAHEAQLRVQQAFQVYGQGRTNRFISPDSTQRRPEDAAERSVRPSQPLSFMEQRTSKKRIVRVESQLLTFSRLSTSITTQPYSCTSKQCIRPSACTKKSVSPLISKFPIFPGTT